jgi:hypothetical protein
MSEEKEKIRIPEDFPGTGTGGPAAPADVEKDPDVLAEEKKSRIWHIKLERYKELAGAIGFFLRTFKAEAVSLVSGLGTLVVGGYQIRKWVVQNHAEIKTERKESQKVETLAAPRTETKTGQGFGSGSGRLGGAHKNGHVSAGVHKLRPLSERMEKVQAQAVEVGSPALAVISEKLTPMSDPMNYAPILTLLVFVWSSWKAWLKKKNKQLENGGQ